MLTVCPSSFHFIFAITALRFPYTKLNSLLPSACPPPLSSPSPPLTTFSATDAYENCRVAAATVPREYLPNISESNPRFYTGKTYLLPPTRLPADFITDRVPITIIDTSASPWGEAPYKDAAERTTMGNLTLDGLLSGWAPVTILDPRASLSNFLYTGHGGNPASATHVTQRELLIVRSNR
uniref:Mitochondrial Rho GTPase 1/3 EF hand associated type-1 domain-containing protein n=1 Tax=Populus alba TaxID=43335 RepID=A0A4U5R2M9_POPAL|nr:hypothetical protein D5086_0000008820 [Populus alba]